MEFTLNNGAAARVLDRSSGSTTSNGRGTAGKARLVRRMRGDDGVALVEAAIYMPVFLLVIFGILEFGLAFKSYLTVSNGARDGSRMASVMADRGDADFHILQDVSRATAAVEDSEIEHIVIWRPTSPSDNPPIGCMNGSSSSGSNPCNVYTPADFARPVEDFGCGVTSPDRYWCPTDRNAALSDPPDYVGVWIQIRHEFSTGMFGEAKTMRDKSVLRIEPQGI